MKNLYLDLINTLAPASDQAQGIKVNPANVMLLNMLQDIKGLNIVLVRHVRDSVRLIVPITALRWAGNKMPIRQSGLMTRHWVKGNPPKSYGQYFTSTTLAEACEVEISTYKKPRQWALLTTEAASQLWNKNRTVLVDPTTGLTPANMQEARRALS